jgi:hypothetical protein
MRLLFRHVPLVVATLLSAPACRRGAVGEPEPDAADIVEGRSTPGVRTDTTEAAFTVSIDRAHWALRARPTTQRDFWSDIAVLDVATAEKTARSVDERFFTVALKTLMESDPDAAAVAFGALHSSATDYTVRTRARVGLTMALSWRSDWPALSRIPVDSDFSGATSDPIVVQAGVERWARALAGVPSPTVSVPDEAAVLPMRRSTLGTPVVTVRINGRPHEFWLDTGASMTLLSSDVAVDAGVVLAAPDTLALGVVAGHIPARAVFIDSLSHWSVPVRCGSTGESCAESPRRSPSRG